jgi:hypothetical protein
MGGSSSPRIHRTSPPTSATPPQGPQGAPAGGGGGGGHGPDVGCPTDFPAEIVDIPEDRQDDAANLAVDQELAIELDSDGDPAFMFGGSELGWLAVNIEEVTECLQAGRAYRARIDRNTSTPAGALIITTVKLV